MRQKLTERQVEMIPGLWGSCQITQTELARMFQVSQATIHDVIKRAGQTRKNHKGDDKACTRCGQTVRVTAGRRQQQHIFCSRECYWKHLYNPNYRRHIWGNILARRKVSEIFSLTAEHVVDHRDGDCDNNAMSNLRVYASQADHMAMHRGQQVKPVWDGNLL